MQEVLVKTHLIITDIHNEYHMNWCGKLIDAKPVLKNGLPVFVIVGSRGRIELNTIDMDQLEKTAKLLTQPKGRSAVSTDKARIFIKEVDGNEMLIGVLTHDNIKTFAPMYDKVGYKK
jgi:hypothetical protein